MEKHALSKSTIIKWMQSEKELYLNKHYIELKEEVSEAQEAMFYKGIQFRELVIQLFPDDINCALETFYDLSESRYT
jgi:hypothetical protein